MQVKRVLGWTALAIPLAVVGAVFVAYWMSDNACGEGNPAVPGDPVKAILYCDYGSADVLKLEDIEKPAPGDGELLVRVRAASVNPLDWHYMRGTPYLIRLDSGLRKPEELRLGVDFSGTVEAVGRNVTRFKPGDDVFGGRTGAFGEYVVVREDRAVVRKPPGVSFEQAAAVPIAALTALQALRDVGQVQPGQKVLINGASGGVGTFAVQLAKHFGAQVTGVCSTRNLEMVRSLGADEVIDYTKEDFTEGSERYDLIVDMVGNHSLSKLRSVMEPDGKTILVGDSEMGNWIGPLVRPVTALLYSKFANEQFIPILADLNQEDLALVGELIQTGRVTPVIDRRYSLAEVPDALRYLEKGHARGKVVVLLQPESGAEPVAAGL
ncbi:MAG TPA: NAD(P)-dependent alcohol dehydrogenase [Woeseiaceae bacterium]|nr:NAD(P)-dependent alcohol dehydrogenase [Woeseiaceae bacterium]